jgi:cytochrome o ubiquinol oxidase subunit 2
LIQINDGAAGVRVKGVERRGASMAKRPSSPKRRILCAGLWLIATTALGGCAGILDPAGPVGEGDARILIDSLLVMLVVAIPTIALGFWMAWRYRASNARAEYRPQWSYSGRIEAITWAIPILVIMFLGGLIWIGSHRLDPFRPLPSTRRPLQVQVVSLDWKWLFIYPEQGIATVNQLVIPAGTPVRFDVTSDSVFNVFFIPRLGSMIYAMPGMISQVNLQADRPVVLDGQSSHFSGDGFSDMRFSVRSVPPADFTAWAQGQRGAGPQLDRAAFAALARPSQNTPPAAYGGVDPTLFQAIATQAIPPGPGPTPEAPSRAGREPSSGGRS